MAILNKKLFSSEKFKEHLNRIISEGDLSVLTATKIRKELEDIYGFERNSMKEQPWKDMLSAMIDEYAASKDGEEQGKSEGEDDEAKSDDDSAQNSNEPMKDKTNDSDKHVKDEMDTDSEQDHKDKSPEPTNQQQDDGSDNDKNDDRDDGDSGAKSDSDMSEAASPPPQKKQRQKKAQPAKQNQTEKKDTGNKTTQDDESIKRLKSYINKCGVRKSWQKELAGCTTKKSQITKLKEILEELGVHGRPTIEKCETVKAERELRAEIDSLDKDNILETADDGPSLRSSGLSAKRKRRPIIKADSDESEGDVGTAAPLDVSFLGDQSDSDSD